MKKIIKSWSVFLVLFFFVAVNCLSYVPVKAAQVELPKIAFAKAEHSPLTYGMAETFGLISNNYVGKVQYRLWLNKKDSKVWMDITGGYLPAVAATTPFAFKYDKALEPGNYNVVAWVKIADTAGTKVNNSGLKYDNYYVTQLKCIKADETKQVSETVYTALGDSIAFGLSAEKGKGYADLFHNYLKGTEKFSKLELNNLSMPGDKSSDLLAKLKNDANIRESVKKSNIITISIGGNNLLSPLIEAVVSQYKLDPKDPEFQSKLVAAIATDTKLQEKMASLMTSETLKAAFTAGLTQFMTDSQSIITETKLLAPTAEIYVMTLYNPLNAKDPFFNLVDPIIQKINATILNSNNLYKVADVYTLFNKYEGTKPLTNFNLLTGSVDPHPTAEGHNLILQAHINAK